MVHAREPLYSKFAVVAGWLQSTRAERIHFCLPGSYKRVSFLQGFIFTMVFSFGIISQIILCIPAQLEPSKSKVPANSGEPVGFCVRNVFIHKMLLY